MPEAHWEHHAALVQEHEEQQELQEAEEYAARYPMDEELALAAHRGDSGSTTLPCWSRRNGKLSCRKQNVLRGEKTQMSWGQRSRRRSRSRGLMARVQRQMMKRPAVAAAAQRTRERQWHPSILVTILQLMMGFCCLSMVFADERWHTKKATGHGRGRCRIRVPSA